MSHLFKTISPDDYRALAVRVPAAHPIYEHFRVRAFAALLSNATEVGAEWRREILGELMYQSHAGYSACGLGSEATDRLVALVRQDVLELSDWSITTVSCHN